jgi:hypothetical protein
MHGSPAHTAGGPCSGVAEPCVGRPATACVVRPVAIPVPTAEVRDYPAIPRVFRMAPLKEVKKSALSQHLVSAPPRSALHSTAPAGVPAGR